eukprot:5857419-Pyramimonas_sp.AAC.1
MQTMHLADLCRRRTRRCPAGRLWPRAGRAARPMAHSCRGPWGPCLRGEAGWLAPTLTGLTAQSQCPSRQRLFFA